MIEVPFATRVTQSRGAGYGQAEYQDEVASECGFLKVLWAITSYNLRYAMAVKWQLARRRPK